MSDVSEAKTLKRAAAAVAAAYEAHLSGAADAMTPSPPRPPRSQQQHRRGSTAGSKVTALAMHTVAPQPEGQGDAESAAVEDDGMKDWELTAAAAAAAAAKEGDDDDGSGGGGALDALRVEFPLSLAAFVGDKPPRRKTPGSAQSRGSGTGSGSSVSPDPPSTSARAADDAAFGRAFPRRIDAVPAKMKVRRRA
jgi:hypothetical protein